MIESNSLRRALGRVREEISPTPDDKARLRARILAPAAPFELEDGGPDAATKAAPAAAPGATARAGQVEGAAQQASRSMATEAAGAVPLTPWAALKAAGSMGAAVGLALLGVGGGLGFWLGHEAASARGVAVAAAARDDAATAPVSERAPRAPEPSTVEPAATPAASQAVDVARAHAAAREPGRADAPRASAPTRAHAARQRAQPNPIDDELALLRRVERALRNNDPALARALLGELDERFPDSRLGEERAAARRIADCRSGEPAASDSARVFLREHGASVYRKRIALACALDGELRDNGGEGAKSVGLAAPMKK